MMKNVIIWLAVVLLVVTGSTRADFILTGNQELTVNSRHRNGTLHDTSSAFFVSGGIIDNKLWVHDYSTLNMSGGRMNSLYSYEHGTVNISGGDPLGGGNDYSLNDLDARQDSTVNMSGGAVGRLIAYDSATVNISDGSLTYLTANNSSSVDISGGSVGSLQALDSVTMNISGDSIIDVISTAVYSTVNISGGSIGSLHSFGFSTVIFNGYDFALSDGLSWDIDGETILGTGRITGKWSGDTSFVIPIIENDPTTTIMAIPEPATLLLLGLGAVVVRRRRT